MTGRATDMQAAVRTEMISAEQRLMGSGIVALAGCIIWVLV
jgi:hypothetical protein